MIKTVDLEIQKSDTEVAVHVTYLDHDGSTIHYRVNIYGNKVDVNATTLGYTTRVNNRPDLHCAMVDVINTKERIFEG